MLGKDPIVLADADALVDSMDLANTYLANQDANRRAVAKGASSAIDLTRKAKSDFTELVDSNWDAISPVAESSVYWTHSSLDQDEETKKRRAAFTAMFLAQDLSNVPEWSAMRDRFEVILELFESQGCFILRRGTIESYFADISNVSGDSKPAGATAEAMSMSDRSTNQLEHQFGDVIRGLRFAASVQPLNEAELIRDALLAVIAPAMARIKAGNSSVDLNAIAVATVGESAQLFDMKVKENGIEVNLRSKTLKIAGFPMRILKSADVIDQVNEQLNAGAD
jgi:hypothetical protein